MAGSHRAGLCNFVILLRTMPMPRRGMSKAHINPRGRRCILRAHDADQDIERGPGMAARERADSVRAFAIYASQV